MKQFGKNFLLRGMVSAWGGPLVLAIIYGILGATGKVSALDPGTVCKGILSLTLLSFLVGGMTAIYQVERLPLPIMILLHGGALYLTYIIAYLCNDWIERSTEAISVFTGVFILVYALIWLIIYLTERAKAERLNQMLKKENRA